MTELDESQKRIRTDNREWFKRCDVCGGSGMDEKNEYLCTVCFGSGEVPKTLDDYLEEDRVNGKTPPHPYSPAIYNFDKDKKT